MSPSEVFSFEFFAMGSPCMLSLYACKHEEANGVAAAAIDEVRRIERLYSRYLSDSLLSEINRAAWCGSEICVDAETSILIDAAFDAYARSGGLFDITSGRLREIWNDGLIVIPDDADIAALRAYVGLEKVSWQKQRLSFAVPYMELDLGGLAKEYAADRTATICREAGSRHGLVNLGGDIAIVGPNVDGSPWRIGISDPIGGSEAIATLFITSGGVATSGNYERFWEIDGRRFSHLIDPKTGWPVESLPSVTVVAPSCLSAGMASTIALLKGGAGPAWLHLIGLDHVYVDYSGKIGGSIRLDEPPVRSGYPIIRRCEAGSSTESFLGQSFVS
jgi:FAD:protein FMN transferase